MTNSLNPPFPPIYAPLGAGRHSGYRSVVSTLPPQHISGHYNILPSPHTLSTGLKTTSECAIAYGGFADVWEGMLGSEKVCVKVLRIRPAHEGDHKSALAVCDIRDFLCFSLVLMLHKPFYRDCYRLTLVASAPAVDFYPQPLILHILTNANPPATYCNSQPVHPAHTMHDICHVQFIIAETWGGGFWRG